ncbi:RNA polymerase sigma factor [Burkholderia perseverans]|uniref:RNA polymerase sigma factor n=1 Tax=Burkholderia perseverans TaxID=2615214 RepID=UPI001FED4D61|nr:RNA polymerase sigma factor [Burkholderia perseverans]
MLAGLLPGMLPRLWVFSLRLCGNRHDAEHMLERACAQGLARAHQWRPGMSSLIWMFSTLHGIWANERDAGSVRSRFSARQDRDRDCMEAGLEPSAGNPEAATMNDRIVAAVERLPEAQRVVMLLIVIEGLRYGEAAEVLGVPVDTVMNRLSHARRAIGAEWGVGDVPAPSTIYQQAGR